MRNIWIIARREYNAYFNSPIAYVVAAVILIIVGIIFSANIYFASQQPGIVPAMDMITSVLAFMLVFTIPAITMRLLTDETRLGTIELLLTAPVRDWEVVVGKWLGAFLFVLSIIAITVIFPIAMNGMVQPGIDQGLVITSYLALIFFTATLVAVGVFVSSLFNNQIASFVTTMGMFIVIWFLLSMVAQLSSGTFAEVVRYLDLQTHFNNLVRGTIELGDVVYYFSMTALFLMLGTVSLESRRWR